MAILQLLVAQLLLWVPVVATKCWNLWYPLILHMTRHMCFSQIYFNPWALSEDCSPATFEAPDVMNLVINVFLFLLYCSVPICLAICSFLLFFFPFLHILSCSLLFHILITFPDSCKIVKIHHSYRSIQLSKQSVILPYKNI